MNPTSLFPCPHRPVPSRCCHVARRGLVAALVVAISLGLAVVSPAAAAPSGGVVTLLPNKPLPDDVDRIISQSALKALNVLNEFVNKGNRDAFDLYRNLADRLAVHVAGALALDVRELQRAWAAADLTRQRAIIAGLTQLGVPYRLNTLIPFKSFDCSGLTSYAWGVAGINIARSSRAQFDAATPIKAEQAQPGDLTWRPGHVGMYLGVLGAVLQAPYGGRSVEIHVMNERIASWTRYADPIA